MRPRLKLSEQGENPSRPELVPLIKRLARLKKEEPALTEGAYRELLLRNRQYAFARYGTGHILITAANNDDQAAALSIPLPIGTAQAECTDLIAGKKYPVENSHINIELEGNSAVIFRITEG